MTILRLTFAWSCHPLVRSSFPWFDQGSNLMLLCSSEGMRQSDQIPIHWFKNGAAAMKHILLSSKRKENRRYKRWSMHWWELPQSTCCLQWRVWSSIVRYCCPPARWPAAITNQWRRCHLQQYPYCALSLLSIGPVSAICSICQHNLE